MTLSTFILQLLNGLAGASSLFLVAAGLSLIFGVTRIVNFAHGSFYMLGAYLAYSLIEELGGGALGHWVAITLAALTVSVLGLLLEVLLLRRLCRAPELLQLIATFGVVLVVRDAALRIWGPEDLLGQRVPGLKGTVEILGGVLPQYDVFLILVGPVVLALLTFALTRTRWGTLVRAAAEDREMTSALGVNQAWLFSGVFFLGSFIAGLGGALALPREPANLSMDLAVIAEVFVVVVVGGMGSMPGAFLAALIISLAKALCITLGTVTIGEFSIAFPKLALVTEFVVMAVVLAFRPWGLLGRPSEAGRVPAAVEAQPLPAPGKRFIAGAAVIFALLALVPLLGDEYSVVLLTDIAIFALFAVSLQFLLGPGGMASFGHAAYFGLGAYGAALAVKHALPMELALFVGPVFAAVGALVYGWFCVRLAGVYLAMLTLAFAQITWAVAFQWDEVTGGSNGLVGVWPAAWLTDRTAYFYLTLTLCALAIALLWRIAQAPFGFALRAVRDSALRAEAIGIVAGRVRWLAFVLSGFFAGLAGALYAFSKGSISPETLAIQRSVDALAMVLLGGVHALAGPIIGAGVFIWLQDTIARETEYWRALLGAIIILIALVFPHGIAGMARRITRR